MLGSFLLALKALAVVLGAGLFLYLLLFLFGNYTVVYKVLPSGVRIKVGYLWRIHGEYILYDSILPFFPSNREGFIKDYEVRPLVVNDQQNKVAKTLGTFTDDGAVCDLGGTLVAKCDTPDKRKSYVSDTTGNHLGYLKGSLRAKSDLTVRGAGFAVLSEAAKGSGRQMFDVRVGFKDLMLPATILYMILFFPLRLVTELFASGLMYMVVMLLYYVLIVACLYVVKYEKTMRNESINYLVGLLDRNVGVTWLNVCIIITAIIGIIVARPHILPLLLVILVGFVINLSCFNDIWHIEQPGADWGERIPPTPVPSGPASPSSSTTQTTRTFPWAPVMALKGIMDCKDEVTVSFDKTDFEGLSATVRKQNPFNAGPIMSEDDLTDRAKEVLAGAKTADGCEQTAIAKILNSAYSLCLKYGLADFEMFELLLGFVQAHVKYVIDVNSESIGNIEEYFRFASETLYDQEGDCDCKSVLAYRLFETIGVDVDLVAVKSGSEDAYNHVAIILKNSPSASIKLPPEFKEFAPGKGVYCESTGKGFKPGEVPDDVDVKSIIVMS